MRPAHDRAAIPARRDDPGRDRPLDLPTLCGPDDPRRDCRLDWSTLMKRAYSVDVLVCPRCAGPMRLVALMDHAARMPIAARTSAGMSAAAGIHMNGGTSASVIGAPARA